MLMFTSLSPGLSALPYVQAVVASTPPGDFDAGKVGLADLGIKPFVLFVLYMAASAISASTSKLNGSSSAKGATSTATSTVKLSAVKNLFVSYFTEPVTAASILALALLICGPFPLSDQWIWGQAMSRLAASCSPAIFLLIGIKLQRPERQHAGLLALMIYRSGLAFIFISILSAVRSMRANEVMFWIFICNSAASFLGNMHIVRVSCQEDQAAHLRFHKLLEVNRGGPQSQAIDDLRNQLDAAALDLGEAIEQACMILNQDTLKLNGMGKGVECAAENQTALQELEHLRSAVRSFVPILSLALITVSFAWTIALSAVISLVPVEVWDIRPVLPGVGIGMVLMGATCLKVTCEQRAKRPESDGSEGVPLPVESARRGSIFDEANPDELTVLEAGEVMQQRASFLPAGEQREIEGMADWSMRQSITHCRQRGSLRSSSSLTASMMMRDCRKTGEMTDKSLEHNRGSTASLQPPTRKRISIDSSGAVGVEVDRQMHRQMHTVSPATDCSLDANCHLLPNLNTGDVQKLQDMPEHPSHRPGQDVPDCPTLLTQPAPSMKPSMLTGTETAHQQTSPQLHPRSI